jgi:hypothetical protein
MRGLWCRAGCSIKIDPKMQVSGKGQQLYSCSPCLAAFHAELQARAICIFALVFCANSKVWWHAATRFVYFILFFIFHGCLWIDSTVYDEAGGR